MNIQTVANNLRNTIAGKELHLANSIKIRDEQDLTLEQEVANYMTIQFLEINIAELKRVLQDVEVCVKQASDDSWITNPDRMGGCYAEDELKESGWK